MRRIRLTIEYDGTNYAGWQRQKNAVAVQQRVEEAIASLTGAAHTITGASRTDAGVHALGQVAHFDTASPIPPEKWCYALNTRLPSDIRIVASAQADPTFHARFHAAAKRYHYRIHSAPHASALLRNQSWHIPYPLDIVAMREAALHIEGTHDFICCMAAGSDAKTTIRTVHRARLDERDGDLLFSIEGNGFLYNMVRILTGTLAYVGQRKLPVDCIQRALQLGDRLLLGPTAPAQGLCLQWVKY